MWWVEVRYGVRRTHDTILLPATDPRAHTAGPYSFRSVYEHGDVRWAGDTGGPVHYQLHSEQLLVDIDGSAEQLSLLCDNLQRQLVAYSCWHTGRRGGHVAIDIEPMTGPRVADDQRHWVQTHVTGADMTIYRPRAMWRLPYAVHEKAPGNIKTLVETRPGRKLVIAAAPPAPPPVSLLGAPATRDDWMRTITHQCSEGGRSTNMYILAKQAVSLGISCADAIQAALWWNKTWCRPPHDPRYVAAKVAANYRQLGG